MSWKRIIYFSVPISILCFTGCQLLKTFSNKAIALTQCKIELVEVEKGISFTEYTSNLWNYVIEITFAAINPTVENITLGGYKLDLYANEKFISKITTEKAIELKANKTTNIVVKTILSPSGVIGIVFKKIFDIPIEYKINGTFYLSLGDFTFPLETTLIKYKDHPNK